MSSEWFLINIVRQSLLSLFAKFDVIYKQILELDPYSKNGLLLIEPRP